MSEYSYDMYVVMRVKSITCNVNLGMGSRQGKFQEETMAEFEVCWL